MYRDGAARLTMADAVLMEVDVLKGVFMILMTVQRGFCITIDDKK